MHTAKRRNELSRTSEHCKTVVAHKKKWPLNGEPTSAYLGLPPRGWGPLEVFISDSSGLQRSPIWLDRVRGAGPNVNAPIRPSKPVLYLRSFVNWTMPIPAQWMETEPNPYKFSHQVRFRTFLERACNKWGRKEKEWIHTIELLFCLQTFNMTSWHFSLVLFSLFSTTGEYWDCPHGWAKVQTTGIGGPPYVAYYRGFGYLSQESCESSSTNSVKPNCTA